MYVYNFTNVGLETEIFEEKSSMISYESSVHSRMCSLEALQEAFSGIWHVLIGGDFLHFTTSC